MSTAGGFCGAIGLRFRNERADRAIRRLEVRLGHALHVGGGHRAPAVALEKQEPPIAQRHRFRQRDSQPRGIGNRLVEIAQRLRADALDFGRRDRCLAHALDGGFHRRARGVERIGERHLRDEGDEARIVKGGRVTEDGGRLIRFDQRRVEAAPRLDGHDLAEGGDCRRVRVRAWNGVIEGGDELSVAHAAQRHRPLAVLHGFLGIQPRQRARRLGDRAERLGDRGERLVRIEFAGDDEHRVVRLVEHAIERLQPPDVDAFDVRARADRFLSVGVPVERRAGQPLQQDAEWAVLSHLHFVADDGHLAVEVDACHLRVDHAIRFHRERPLQVRGRGIEGFEVIRAVVPRGRVEAHAALVQLGFLVARGRRALEQHVLEQVRHAGLAVVLVARTDQVGQVDGRLRRARVREQQDREPVRERVLRDTLDGRALRDAGRKGRRRRQRDEGGDDDQNLAEKAGSGFHVRTGFVGRRGRSIAGARESHGHGAASQVHRRATGRIRRRRTADRHRDRSMTGGKPDSQCVRYRKGTGSILASSTRRKGSCIVHSGEIL